ncbi:MAG: HAD-IA family hydrolase [Prevotella sp.]|nr:HAD-IA family hydrolase [Prevotella sp.]
MEYQAYIFDLDGTLLDTLDDLAASTNFALRTHHMPEHGINDVRRFVGNGVRKLMERAVPGGVANPHFEQALATFREHYTQHSLDTTRPYPGIIDLLQRLKASGKKVAVVSNKFDAATKALCQHFFASLVDVAIGESERVRKKPAPDTVMEALRLLEVEKEQAVYIGDSDVDIATARNSGIPCISVTWGFRDRTFLLGHGALILVENPAEIAQI